MKTRSATAAKAKASATKAMLKGHDPFFPSPITVPSPDPSPKSYDFDLPSFSAAAAAAAVESSSRNTTPRPFLPHPSSPLSSKAKTATAVSTVVDLKTFASSRIDSLKRHLDACHSDILKEFEASHARLSKRLKIQTKACVQLTEDAEKDYKKFSEKMSEHIEIMKASYAELISEAHSTTSRVGKVSIPELMQSMEKAIDGLRSRYKIPASPM